LSGVRRSLDYILFIPTIQHIINLSMPIDTSQIKFTL
jgi:hypothetical protein